VIVGAFNRCRDANAVWMVIPSFYPLIGGAETQAHCLSRALTHRGWNVRVLTRRDSAAHSPRLPRRELVHGVDVIRVSSRGPGKIASVQYLLGGLAVLVKAGNGAIFHAHDIGAPGLLAAIARRICGGRSVVKLRTGALAYKERFGGRLPGRVFRFLLRCHDRIVVVNSEVEELLITLGIPPHKIVRIPNAIDGHVFRGSTLPEVEHARNALKLPLDKKVVLYVGRLAPVKRIDILLTAWSMLPEPLREESVLVLVGQGPSQLALAELVDDLGIQSSVLMLGARSDVNEYYRAANVFVLPSRTEGLSNALLEAMASELPVVATAVGGAIDVVEDQANGVLVAPEDAQDLNRGLRFLLSRPAEWQAMGRRGRRKVLDYAGLDVGVERLIGVYSSLWSS
jgi:glycosyltransferase involved in cell wall biosynthesis